MVENQQYIDSFLAHSKKKNLSARTQVAYGKNISDFLGFWQKKHPKREPLTATTEDILAYFDHLKKMGCSPASLRRQLSALRNFYNYHHEIGNISTPPTKPIASTQFPDQSTAPKPLTVQEIHQVLDSINTNFARGIRKRAIIELLWATGMQSSELLALDFQDIDLDAGTVMIRGEDRIKPRIMPLSPGAKKWLIAYLHSIGKSVKKAEISALGELAAAAAEMAKELGVKQGETMRDKHALFVGVHGKRIFPQHLFDMLKRQGKGAGLNQPLHANAFRRAYATRMLEYGVPVASLQELMGHTSIDSTKRYLPEQYRWTGDKS